MVMRVGAGAPSGASIGHVLSDRLAELRAATKNIGAHAKAGLDLASTDHQCRALLAENTHLRRENVPGRAGGLYNAPTGQNSHQLVATWLRYI